MREYEAYLTNLGRVPENQKQPQSFALQQALNMLVEAGVIDAPEGQRSQESPQNASETTDLPLGQFIKRARRALHPPVSQERLARRAGLSVAWEQQVEQDRPVKPSVEALCRLAIAMELNDEKAEEFVSTYGKVETSIASATAKVMLPVFRQQFVRQGQLVRLRK